ncbi:uncharacterized protein ARMOST_16657 [Armillaria ostoyae]|uniref:Uncharacterized protein n=1 Tax=Armillaria ostoyae TaxID=47428 RepID=A0A284RWU2_ARMOS|nr:uncharacterized protein ARMOST_16657 [Armillaria ostoyae]
MGRTRIEPTAIPWKQSSHRSQALQNCPHDLAYSLIIESYNSSSSSPDSSIDALSAVSPVSTDANAEDLSILSHRNRKTSEAQTAILKQLLPDYHHHSANGLLRKFRARVNFRWAQRFPETYRCYLLDRDEGIRLIPPEFEGVFNSPTDVPYPKMSEGVLDFGPGVPCYDKCPLVRQEDIPDYKEILTILLKLLRQRRNMKKERELIRAFKNGTLKSSDLTEDGKIAVIDSLYREFGNMFRNVVEYLGWGVVIIAGGIDPRTGRIRTVGYNYGCTAANGKDFIGSFNDAAEAGYIPGTNEGESRDFSQYYGLPFMLHMKKVHLSRNGPPPTTQQKEYVESPADVDPATLVTEDSEDLIQAPVEVSAPVPLPPVFSSVPSDGMPSTSVPSYSIPSHPLPATALTPPSVSSPLPPTTMPHPQGTTFISPQPDAVSSSFASETPMDTSSDNLTSSWAYSHSIDSVIDNDLAHFGADVDYSSRMDIDTISPSQSLDFSHLSWNTEMPDTKDDNLAHVMEALGLGDMFVSDTATDRSTCITESSSTTLQLCASPDLQSPLSDQPTADVIMDNTEAAADCHTTPKSDVLSAPSLPPSLPDIVNLPRLPRQRKAPPPREVTTLCGAEQELGPPQWHQESLMALQDHSLGPDWIGLVEKWYQLESSMWKIKANTEGKYPLWKRRPQELNEWLNGSRQFNAEVFISDPSRYGTQLVDWWNHLNPVWRRSNDKSGFPRPDYSKSLKCLRKGGHQGIVTIVFGLFWWGRACSGTEQLWHRMVEDVSKTIDVLV